MLDDKCNKSVGIYDVLSLCSYRKNGHKVYRVRCRVCGKEFEKEYRCIADTKFCYHNYPTWENRNQRLRHIYKAMVRRCYDQNRRDYKYYGGRGIKICDEWLSDPKAFEEWALSNGYKEGFSIDRIDSNKGYCPENCRWISISDNARRAGKVNWVAIDGQCKTGRQWSEYFGLGVNYVNRYIRKYGLPVTEQLLTAMYSDRDVQEKIEKTHSNQNLSLLKLYGIQV